MTTRPLQGFSPPKWDTTYHHDIPHAKHLHFSLLGLYAAPTLFSPSPNPILLFSCKLSIHHQLSIHPALFSSPHEALLQRSQRTPVRSNAAFCLQHLWGVHLFLWIWGTTINWWDKISEMHKDNFFITETSQHEMHYAHNSSYRDLSLVCKTESCLQVNLMNKWRESFRDLASVLFLDLGVDFLGMFSLLKCVKNTLLWCVHILVCISKAR